MVTNDEHPQHMPPGYACTLARTDLLLGNQQWTYRGAEPAADVSDTPDSEPAPPAPSRPEPRTSQSASEAVLIPDAVPQAGERAPLTLREDLTDAASKQAALDELDQHHVKGCTHCQLCESRKQTVFGEGSAEAAIMFIGEGPGADEDEQGRPFVGRAGKLLDKQIAAMKLTREDVYIANVVKCRPPGNRVPVPEEAQACRGYLDQQIAIIQPKVIVTLGATATKLLLEDPRLAITRERGKWRQYAGIDLMPTFHPAYLLRQYTADNRQKVWSDLQAVMEKVGLK